jgi:excisionase family DNA binding protein
MGYTIFKEVGARKSPFGFFFCSNYHRNVNFVILEPLGGQGFPNSLKGGLKMEKFLSVMEAAEFLNVSPHTLRSWTSQRRIPFIKLHRRVLFRLADLDAFIETCVVPPRRPHVKGVA